jgi:predicted PurR-regulated permease PerM
MTEQAAWRVVVRGICLIFGLILLALLVRELQTVIVQLLLAILLAAAVTPSVDRATRVTATDRRWRVGRGLAAAAVSLGGAIVLALASIAVLSTALPDLARLVANLPVYAGRVQHAIADLAVANPELAARLSGALPSVADAAGGASALLSQAPHLLGVATGVFSAVLHVVFTLFLALYLTIDGERIRRYAIEFLPFDRHGQALELTDRIGTRLGSWARGEALLAAIIGGMTWVGTSLIGLPYAAALALIAGAGELVPTLGPIIAAIPLIAVGLLSSPTQGLLALILAVTVQQLENNLIVPRVMGQAVDLHPVVVMLAILAGGELLGISGALLAVPVVASLSVVVDEFRRERVERHRRAVPGGFSQAAPVRGAVTADGATSQQARPQ